MGFSLRDKLKEVTAQVNPFDGGRTARTVRNERQVDVAQTRRPSVPYYGSFSPQVQTTDEAVAQTGRNLGRLQREGLISSRQFSDNYNSAVNAVEQMRNGVKMPTIGGLATDFVKGTTDTLTKNIPNRLARALPGGNADIKAQENLTNVLGQNAQIYQNLYKSGRINQMQRDAALNDLEQANQQYRQSGDELRRAGSVGAGMADAINVVSLYNPVTAAEKGIAKSGIRAAVNKTALGKSIYQAPQAIKTAGGATTKLVNKAMFSQAQGLKGVLATGAKQGAITGAANELYNENPTLLGAAKGATTGLVTGAAMGAGFYGGGKLLGGAIDGSKEANFRVENNARRSAGLPERPRYVPNENEYRLLKDYADAKAGAWQPDGLTYNQLQQNAINLTRKTGVDFVNGSPNQVLDNTAGFLDSLDRYSKAEKDGSAQAILQGGYAKNPLANDAPQGKTPTTIDNVKLPSGYHTVADITKELKRQGITQKMLDDTQAIDMGTFDNSGKVETDSVLYFLKENFRPNEMFAPQVGKTDPLESLKQEARKYKSAEEFADSLNAMKYGKVTGVGQLPVSKINKTQIKALTERGLPHTDTNLKVSDFKPGRQVTQPLEVYSKGGSWVVENGNHRLAQALANGDETVPVVFKGGEGKKYSTPITDLYNQATQSQPPKSPLKTDNYLDTNTSQQVLNKTIQPKSELWSRWFRQSDYKALPEIEQDILKNPQIKDAGTSRMYDYYKEMFGENMTYDEFLNKDITLYRGGNTRATNNMASYSLLERKAKRFGDVSSVTVKPKDTYGMLGDFSEGEVFVPAKSQSPLTVEKKPTIQDALAGKSTRPMSIEDPEARIRAMKDMPLDKTDEGTFAMPRRPKIKERGGEKTITVKRQAPTLNEISPEGLRDISGLEAQFKDIYRNTDKVFGNQSEVVRQKILNPLDDAKSKFIDFQEGGAKDLKANIVDKLGIKKGSRESALVQLYGEGKVSFQDILTELGSDGANKIVQADKFFRARYDQLLTKINEARMVTFNGDKSKLIPKRSDYYRHFQDMQEGIAGLKNIFDNNANISPELAGVSDFTKPKSKWLSLAQRRMGDKTTYDAVGGYINYLQAASYASTIDPMTARIRNFREELVGKMGDDGKINNYLEYLHDYANDLAGKTNSLDRFTQKLTGRKAFRTLDWINKRAKSNAILGNFSSSIAQFFNIPNGIADAGVINSAKGAKEFFKQIGGGKSPADQSIFLKERFAKPFSKFDTGVMDKTKNAAAALVTVGDEVGTRWIWHSEYQNALSKGMTGDKAVRYADGRTRAVVAGRGVGEVPLLQKSKTFQLIAPFQLEVANQWQVFGDAKNAKRLTKHIIIYSIAAGLMNKAAEQIRGNDVAFDPLDALADAWKEMSQADDPTTEKDESKDNIKKAFGRVGGEVLGNVPGGGYIAQALAPNEFERKAYFGNEDPSRFGTSPLAVTSTFGAAKGIVEKPSDLYSYLKAATGVGTPFAGKQIERTTKAVTDMNRGYTTDKDGDPKFVTPTGAPRAIQAALFGTNATPEARTYFNEGKKPLTTEQSKEALQGDKQTKVSNIKSALEEREINKKVATEKATLKDAKKLSNGKYAVSINGETKTFKTKEQADKAVFENEFVANGTKKAEYGDFVYLRDPTTEKGYRKQSKSDYENDKAMQGVAINLDKTKAANNLGEWNKVADKKYQALTKKLENLDPEVDFKEIDSINKQILDLQQEYDKYNSRGYISKGTGSGGSKGGNRKAYKMFEYGNPATSLNSKLQAILESAKVG